jgi:hypothetical protein
MRIQALIAAVLVAPALALAGTGTAVGRAIDPARSTVGDSARLSASANAVQLNGVVRCTGCRRFTLGVTVSQAGSGAVAQGGVRCTCRGASERWAALARTREGTKFRPGPARVCVWVIARGGEGTAIDAEQWCERLTLRGAA